MQTAHSDEWRPGFAKRADNFNEVCSKAEAWRWRAGETIARVAAAVLKGTPTLTAPQRLTLLLYVEHLNQERLEQGNACVWPSTTLIADYLGCSASSARSNRRALEAAGFMVRDYNHANRPAGLEAYDLRPLMARLEDMEGADQAVRDAAAARRAAYSEALVFPTRYSAQAPESRRLEQSQENFSYTVTENDADSPRIQSVERPATRPVNTDPQKSSTTPHRGRTPSAIGSPEGASGLCSGHSSPSAHAEMVRQELHAAVRVSPRLAALVGDHLLKNPAAATLEDAARIIAAGPLLLPDAERNNGLSVEWGWNRHGVRVIAMLAIALEDPEVRNPCKYFGWMATRDPVGAPDLRINLRRLLARKGDLPPVETEPPTEVGAAPSAEPPLMFSPGLDTPPWPEINAELRRLIRDGAHGSWFGRVRFHGLEDGVLILSTPTGLAADRIKQDYVPAILQAAENVGVFVERVSLTVRKR
jgi:hypothetical protein